MLLKVYKSSVWILLVMLLPFLGTAQIPGLPSGWEFTENPTSHVLAIPTTVTYDVIAPLVVDDWVGVFYDDAGTLKCAGAVQWMGTENVAVVAFGNDTLEAFKNGFYTNEAIQWKVYRTATSTEECAKAYDAANTEFLFVNGALSAVSKISAFPIVTCPGNMTGVKTTDPAFNLTGGLPAGGVYSGPGVAGGTFTPATAGVGTHTITYTYTQFDCSDFCTFTIEVIPGSVTQTVNYVTGWNWISFNVLPVTPTVNNTLAGFVPQAGDILKNQTQTMIYSGTVWNPNLTIDPDKAYLLKTAKPAGSFVVTNAAGNYVNVIDPITINAAGWTWIGYKPRVQLSPAAAFVSMAGTFTNQDQVKNQTSTAIYNGGTGTWLPGTFKLNPGSGYKLKYQRTPGNTLTYPPSDGSASVSLFSTTPKAVAGDPGWAITPGMETNMSVYVTSARLNGVPVLHGKVAAFHTLTNQCRALEEFFDDGTGVGQVILTVGFNSNEAGNSFYYLVWNSDNDVVYEVNETGIMVSDDFQMVDLTLVPPVVLTNISGTVTDESTSLPIANVEVSASSGTPPTYGPPDWAITPGMETNMSVYVTSATLASVPVQFGKVAAFHTLTGQCRALEEFFDGGGMGQVILTVGFNSNEAGNTFYYKVWNSENNIIYDVNETGVMVSDDFQMVDLTLIGAPAPVVISTTTDANGFYIFDNIADGTYTLCTGVTVATDGYVDECAPGTVTTPPSAVVDFALVPIAPPCEDVVITGFPVALDNLCVGTAFEHDFSYVLIENAETIEWTVTPEVAGIFGGPDGDDFTLNTSYVGDVTITVVGNAFLTCLDATESVTFTVYDLPVVTCPPDFAVCIDDEPWTIWGMSPAGGVFTGVGVVNGVNYDPALAGVGVHEITYTYTDVETTCTNSCTFNITVNALPVFDCPAYGPFCAGEDAVVFEGVGVYTFDGAVVTGFDPAVAGSYLFVYTVTENGCSASCEFTIDVNALPVVTCPADFAVCVDAPAFDLTGGLPAGGVYADQHGVETSFDPSMEGVGNHEFTYTYTDGNGCTNSCTFNITVNPLPVFDCPAYGPYFAGDPAVVFTETGVFTLDNEVVLGFNPETAGDYLFTYTVTENGCSASCEFTIVVNPVVPPVCPGWANLQWPPSGTITIGDDYTVYAQIWIDGVTELPGAPEGLVASIGYSTENTNPALWTNWVVADYNAFASVGNNDEFFLNLGAVIPASGVYYYASRFVYNNCETVYGGFQGGFWDGVNNVSGVLTVEQGGGCVNPPTAFAGANAAICADGDYLIDDATATNYSAVQWYTLTGDGSFNDETLLNPTYTPGTLDLLAGSVELCFTAFPTDQLCEPAVDCMVLTFNALPVVTCPADFAVCVDAPAFDLTGGLPAGGVYADQHGVETSFDPAMEGVGDHEFTYTYTDGNGCTNSCTFVITVNPLPTYSYEISSTEVCAGEGVTYTNHFTGTAPWTVEFYANGVLGSFTTSENPEIFYEVLTETTLYEPFAVTDGNGCTASVNQPVTIIVNPLPTYSYELSATDICYGEEVTYTEYFTGTAPWTVEYYWNGVLESFTTSDNPSITSEVLYETSVYEPVSVTDGTGCSSVVNQPSTITVHPLPVAVCEDFELCENSGIYEFPAIQYVEYYYNEELVASFDPSVGAGEYMFTKVVGTEFGCTDQCTFTITVLPIPVIVAEPENVAELYGGVAVFTVGAQFADSYQWYGPAGMIDGETGMSLMIFDITLADEGEYYVAVTNECETINSDVVTLDVLPWTQTISLPSKVNGVSTYLDLIDNSVANNVAPLGTNLQYFSFMRPDQTYIPGGVDFPWTEERGAKLGLKTTWPTSINVVGWPTLGTEVTLPAGWSLVPVWSQGVVSADDVFGPLGSNLVLAMGITYANAYWPAKNIYTLENLVPGRSYLVNLVAPATLDFDVPIIDKAITDEVFAVNNTSWNDIEMTGTMHAIAITTDAFAQLERRDVIGIFNQNGTIAGMVELENLTDNAFVSVYADNSFTDEIEGFVNGDLMTFKVYRNGEEIDATASFDPSMPNTNIFNEEGISVINGLKLSATSINEVTSDLNVQLFPNPAKNFVNIQSNFEISSLKVVNYVGQVVFDRPVDQTNIQINTSSFSPGMYFVQIQSVDGTVITKRLTIN